MYHVVRSIIIYSAAMNLSVHQQMNGKRRGVYIYNGILFSFKKEGNTAICNNMSETGEHYAK